MTRALHLSGFLLLLLPPLLSSMGGGCGGEPKIGQAPEPTPDAGEDVLDELREPSPDPGVAFGRACEEDADCGLELDCITADSNELARGGPPRGLCTASCDDDPDVCEDYADGALCVRFGASSFCIEGCEYGTLDAMAFDREKCHGRREFVCRPVMVDTGNACGDEADCDDDEVCDATCHTVPTGCMPQCNGDFDCPTGRFCDPKTGECIENVPVGRQLGESCRSGEDDCRGVCAQVGGASDWTCAEPCTLGVYPSCGSPTDPAEVGCAIVSGQDASFGDLGWCATLCDCNNDCPVGRQCLSTDREYLGRPGYCGVPGADSMVRATCPNEGTGGSSGTGSGGTGGQGGSPASAGQAGQSSK